MSRAARDPARFSAALLDGLDEPVRRHLRHVIADGAALPEGMRIRMRGSIRAGAWLPFSAEQTCAPRAFTWTARVRVGPVTLLRVIDSYDGGAARSEARLLGRVPLARADDADTVRSAATRAALDAVAFALPTLVTAPGVRWEARGADLIAASWDIPPERPVVHIGLGTDGGARTVSAMRWGRHGTERHEYIPCGGEILAERRFGPFLLPSRVRVGWWWGTPRYAPFFRAEIVDIIPVG